MINSWEDSLIVGALTVTLTLQVAKQIFLHDTPAADDAPPNQLWLQG